MREQAFVMGMIKAAATWRMPGMLPDPAAVRARNLALAAGLGGAVIGASGAAALAVAMQRKRRAQRKK